MRSKSSAIVEELFHCRDSFQIVSWKGWLSNDTKWSFIISIPSSKDMYSSLEGSTYSPKMASPCAKVSPRTNMLKRWPRVDERRILHVVYRVGNIEDSIEYYQECMEMHILRKVDFPEDKYLKIFMGYGIEDNHLVVELTYNYGVTKYEIGTGLNHFGITVPNVQNALDAIRKKGFPAPESPSVDLNKNVYASIKDPDGYTFKLIQRAGMRERFWQVSYNVADVDAAVLFYQDAFGMHLLSRDDYPLAQRTFAYLAYDLDDRKTTVIELQYHYGVTQYTKGTGYDQLSIGTDDVYKTANAVELQKGRTVRPPGPLPGIPTKIYICLDPDDWKVVFIDNWDFAREQEPASFVPRVTTSLTLPRGTAHRCPGHAPMSRPMFEYR